MGGGYHHHGGFRRGGFRRGFRPFGVDVIDTVYVEPECPAVIDVLPDAPIPYCCKIGQSRCRAVRQREAGDILPTLVGPDAARKYIDETDAGYNVLDASIQASNVPADFKTGWNVQLAAWKTFAVGARSSVGFLDAKAIMDQTDRWQTALGNWSTQFHALSPSSAIPNPVQAGQGMGEQASLSDITKLVLAGGLVAGIVILGPKLMR